MALFSDLVDNFNDNSINLSKWYTFTGGSAGGTVRETNSQMKFSLPASSVNGSSGGIESQTTYSMAETSVHIQVIEVPSALTNANGEFILYSYTDNYYVRWVYEAGTLYAQRYVGSTGITTTEYSVAFNASTHKWWRLRQSGTHYYWDTSTDGLSWSNRASWNTALDVTTLAATVDAYTYQNETNPGNFIVDNFNTTPSVLGGSQSTTVQMEGVEGGDVMASKASGAQSTSMVFSELADSQATRIETNPMRKIVENTRFAWNKTLNATYTLFTIGVSRIGGGDYIASDAGVVSDWNNYQYVDESAYVTQLNYEQELNTPLGGLVKGIGDIELDNTSERFTPDYMGGHSELFTSVGLIRRPLIINAGFNYGGIDNMNPQFVGITTKAPEIKMRQRSVGFHFADFIEFLQNKYVDETAMYTGIRSDVLIENMLTYLGFATSQYLLDTGINIIPFAYLPAGSKFGDIINEIVQAENAHMYQDVNGVIRFENRQHWNTSPYTYVTRNITTAMVLEAEGPADDHIINVVEVNSTPYTKQPSGQIYSAPAAFELDSNGNTEIFINFDNPVLEANTPSYTVNTASDGSGSDITGQVSLVHSYVFAQAAKYTFHNTSSSTGFITSLTVNGREAAPSATPIYFRKKDDSSVTAFDERPIVINNNYIQTLSWARSYADLILNDFSDPANLQIIKIRAIPGLKISDLISWQGRHWRIFGIKTTMNPAVGFVQELSLLKREVVTYFRIGISLIGGSDPIAP